MQRQEEQFMSYMNRGSVGLDDQFVIQDVIQEMASVTGESVFLQVQKWKIQLTRLYLEVVVIRVVVCWGGDIGLGCGYKEGGITVTLL